MIDPAHTFCLSRFRSCNSSVQTLCFDERLNQKVTSPKRNPKSEGTSSVGLARARKAMVGLMFSRTPCMPGTAAQYFRTPVIKLMSPNLPPANEWIRTRYAQAGAG